MPIVTGRELVIAAQFGMMRVSIYISLVFRNGTNSGLTETQNNKRSAPSTPHTSKKPRREADPDFSAMASDIRKNTKLLTPATRQQLVSTNLHDIGIMIKDAQRMHHYFKARYEFLDEIARRQMVVISSSEDEVMEEQGEHEEEEGEGQEEQ